MGATPRPLVAEAGIEPASRSLLVSILCYLDPMTHARKISKARLDYLANPHKCHYCGGSILPRTNERLFETKKKKFCNRHCSSTYNNAAFPKRKRRPRHCFICKKRIEYERPDGYIRKLCSECLKGYRTRVGGKTKKQTSPRAICSHARWQTRSRQQRCISCNYDRHVETCHLKPISKFSPLDQVDTINNPKNLILLCRNCHWEFDHGLLVL